MKRFHVHLAVQSIEESVGFYSRLFGQAPSLQKDDYAKWMLDDPLINFAISHRPDLNAQAGLSHMGFQVDTPEQLQGLADDFHTRGLRVHAMGENNCCYSESVKGWIMDPQGIAWESFVTSGSSTVYGNEPSAQMRDPVLPACCASDQAVITQRMLQEIDQKTPACCG